MRPNSHGSNKHDKAPINTLHRIIKYILSVMRHNWNSIIFFYGRKWCLVSMSMLLRSSLSQYIKIVHEKKCQSDKIFIHAVHLKSSNRCSSISVSYNFPWSVLRTKFFSTLPLCLCINLCYDKNTESQAQNRNTYVFCRFDNEARLLNESTNWRYHSQADPGFSNRGGHQKLCAASAHSEPKREVPYGRGPGGIISKPTQTQLPW